MKINNLFRLLPAVMFAGALSAAPLASAQTTPAPANTMAPAANTMAPASNTMAPMASPAVTKTVAGKLPKSDEFTSQSAALAHCPTDTVVWSTLSKSKSFHVASSKYFGKTKHGAFVCKGDATTYGFHSAKS